MSTKRAAPTQPWQTADGFPETQAPAMDVQVTIAGAGYLSSDGDSVALVLREAAVQPIPEGMVDSLHRIITDAGFPYDAEEAVEAACEALQAASIARALAKRVRLHR